MLSHRQNSHAPRGRRYIGRGETQSRELVNRFKILPVYRDMDGIVKVKFSLRLIN
jgi:hypothetical protein